MEKIFILELEVSKISKKGNSVERKQYFYHSENGARSGFKNVKDNYLRNTVHFLKTDANGKDIVAAWEGWNTDGYAEFTVYRAFIKTANIMK